MISAAEPNETVARKAQLREASRLLAKGDTEAVLVVLAPLTGDDSPDLAARFLLSMTAWKMGRLDWSLDVMRECHALWPMDGTVAEALASLYAQSGNLGESFFMGKLGTALGGVGELADLIPAGFPGFDRAFYRIKARPLREAALASLAKGEVRQAIDKARQHVALEPGDGDGRALCAEALLRNGEAGAAVEVLDATKDIAENSASPAAFMSLYARALTAVGEVVEGRRWHAQATKNAPEDAAVAAARVADGLWLEQDPSRLTEAGAAWARRFCPPAAQRRWQRPHGKLVIGYLVPAFTDPQDAAALAAVARAHDRAHVVVIGYGRGAQVWPENAPLRGVFDSWQDIATLDPGTLARFFVRGGLHVVVDASGFATPLGLLALAALPTAIRVAWLGNACGIGSPIYDAQIVAESAGAASIHATPWHVPGGYPLLPSRKKLPRVAHAGIHFGADVKLAQLDSETIAVWSAALQAQPEGKLLLRSNDMVSTGNVDRLVNRFGRELASRIDIVTLGDAAEFYAGIDVALAPRRGASPRMAAEALACGVPTVALAGTQGGEPYAVFLKDLGLGSLLIGADTGDYARLAALATAPEARAQIAAAMNRAAPGEESARRFARAIEEHAKQALESAVELAS